MNKAEQKQKWFSTQYRKAAPSGSVDADKGVIEGALITTEGEAKGHGVFLEPEFVDEVVKQGNESKAGLKARFGHPNMCSTALGTFIGRWKNFRRETVTRDDGSQAVAARADLFLSTSAKETPNGDLYNYVLGLAKNEPDMFGTSIVFSPGDYYLRTQSGKKVRHVWSKDVGGKYLRNEDGSRAFRYVGEDGKEHDPTEDPIVERDFVTCEKLHACDAVDDPAANDGLFSAFSNESLAGQLTEFLDLHPEVWAAAESNPEVLEALTRYGDRLDEFLGKYRDYKNQKEAEMATENQTGKEGLENGGAADADHKPETQESAPDGGQQETQTETGNEGAASAETEGAGTAEEADKPTDGLSKKVDEALSKLAASDEKAKKAASELEAALAELAKLKAERDESLSKLASFEKGAPPVSATPAPNDGKLTAWDQAVESGRNRK